MTSRNEVAVVKRDDNGIMNTNQTVSTLMPLVDIYETNDAFVLLLDMPGAQKDSISVTLDKASLKVRGSVDSVYPHSAKVLRHEIDATTYQRVFNLSDGIDSNNVDAHFENGVLTIKLFKKEEIKPREIRIQ